MTRTAWIIVVVVGVVIAVVLGLAGNSQTAQEKQLCSSLSSLQADVNVLMTLNPSTGSQGQLQADLAAIQTDWSNVTNDVSAVAGAASTSLKSAWSGFVSAVQTALSAGSVGAAQQAITPQAQALQAAIRSTGDSVHCD